jgi:hypothetical protein
LYLRNKWYKINNNHTFSWLSTTSLLVVHLIRQNMLYRNSPLLWCRLCTKGSMGKLTACLSRHIKDSEVLMKIQRKGWN